MNEFQEKIRTIGQVRSGSKKTRKTTVIPEEANPKRAAGKQEEHWDGRVDATAYAQTAKVKVKMGGEDG